MSEKTTKEFENPLEQCCKCEHAEKTTLEFPCIKCIAGNPPSQFMEPKKVAYQRPEYLNHIKIVFTWAGMKCKNCYRYQSNGVCDLLGPQDSNNYCQIYIPHPKLHNKEQMATKFSQHIQRWIIERQ